MRFNIVIHAVMCFILQEILKKCASFKDSFKEVYFYVIVVIINLHLTFN